jgi:1-acyl-sn-glycerol-3-phosphate acyltransferase
MIILKLFYSVFFFSYMIAMLLISVACLYAASVFKKDKGEFLFLGSKSWARRLILPVIAKVKMVGLENIPKGKPVIYVSNHQSYFDIPVLLAYLPGSFRFIVKKEFFSAPVFGGFTRRSGHLSVDREVGSEAHKTLLEAASLLNAGKSVIIFPEGTRSRDGALGKFKRGGFAIAFESGAPIVPVAISGSYKIMRRNAPLLWPSRVTVRIDKPISLTKVEKPTRELYDKTMAFVRDRIEKMLAEKIETDQ